MASVLAEVKLGHGLACDIVNSSKESEVVDFILTMDNVIGREQFTVKLIEALADTCVDYKWTREVTFD